ncbi:hypothetical protein HAX54_045088 [Datura stramonium]|uniref:Uncharacterized protein n=1 Tax=Datura stramonium TaxID=4076 RepID=A0ABS8WJD7_DATST|nr:hypothetical protein [Datura stramonium]
MHMEEKTIEKDETSPNHDLAHEEVMVNISNKEEGREEVVKVSTPSPNLPIRPPSFPKRVMKKHDDAKTGLVWIQSEMRLHSELIMMKSYLKLIEE